MKRAAVPALLAIALTAASAGAQAQELLPGARQVSVPARVSAVRLIPGAILGSAAGIYLGALAGERVGWGGGDDPGLTGMLVFGALGGAVGTGIGVHYGANRRVSPGAALNAGVIGTLGGVLGAVLLSTITDGSLDEVGVVIGYSAGQGISAAAIASLFQSSR